MNRWARLGILAVSLIIFGWVGLGHVLGRTVNDKAYKSLVVYSEVLQKIQQDYVDEPNMHLVEAGSLHGLLESLDSESSYLTPREYTEYKQKASASGTGETGLNLSKRFGYIIVTSLLPDSSAEKAGLHSGDIFESIAGFTTREMSVGQAQNLLAGQQGTGIKVGVIRRGKTDPDEINCSED
jgi:carboxyl-terminal processing protease